MLHGALAAAALSSESHVVRAAHGAPRLVVRRVVAPAWVLCYCPTRFQTDPSRRGVPVWSDIV